MPSFCWKEIKIKLCPIYLHCLLGYTYNCVYSLYPEIQLKPHMVEKMACVACFTNAAFCDEISRSVCWSVKAVLEHE